MSLTDRASRWLASQLVRRMLPLRGERGVVSFTFDDALLSACRQGAAVLERRGVRGTYYVAGGLTDGVEEGRPCHTLEALRALLAAGHQLGCHSYSHVRMDLLAAGARQREFGRNAEFLAGLGLAAGALDFAYPFGGVGLGAKRDCARRFRSSRATGGGTHLGQADLDALRTHRFYAGVPDVASYEERLRQAAEGRGWLVVNTHEVEDGHGPYGCTPAALDRAVAQALDAGCAVLPVSAALDHWVSRAA